MAKIIMVSNTSWYLFNFRLSIIKLLQERGYEVICIANRDEYSERLEKEGAVFIPSTLSNKGTNPLSDYNYYRFLLWQYKTLQPEFIIHYTVKPNIYGSIAARNQGLRSIAVVSGAGYAFLNKGLLNSIVRRLYTYAAKCSEELWFVNKDDQELFLSAGITKAGKTKVLPGEGINTEKFKRDVPYCAGNDRFEFILSARLLWDKGIGIFVEAAREVKKEYPQAQFKLLGFIDALNPSAITREQIDQWVDEGIIEYLGVTDNVRPFLCRANCFVLPSYYREGVPRALLEAASLEMPIITTNNVGCREVVENGYNGFICSVKDSADLARQMKKMLELGEQELRQMGINGRKKIITEFHEDLVLRFYKNLLTTL